MEGRNAVFVTFVENRVEVEELTFGPQYALPKEGINAHCQSNR